MTNQEKILRTILALLVLIFSFWLMMYCVSNIVNGVR
ncbi:MAG: hypothetical protein RL095_1605 [Verrucomicrobiota bacterium]|jgi:hypothetical protein